MPATTLQMTLVTLKQGDTAASVLLRFQSPNGMVRFEFPIPAADFTSINTTTNGGATGATQTFNYAQDANRAVYDPGFFQEVP